MRAELKIKLASNGLAIIKEVRAVDFKQALISLMQDGDRLISEVDSAEWDNCWQECGLIDISGEPSASENELIAARFLFINSAFFQQPKSKNAVISQLKDNRLLSKIVQDLNQSCAALISHNHQNVWDYGWSFFQVVQDLYKDKG